MGSSLRRFSGTTYNMYKLLVCSFLAMAAAAPIEDTPEVAEAKATFKAAFDAAEAGEHAALRPDALHPVNNDVQASQMASAYLDDVEEVAAAKAEFQAAFDDAAAGGLAAKQAPAPVHTVAAPVVYTGAVSPYAAYPYLTSYPYHHAAYTYAHVGAYPYAAATHAYAAYPYAAYPYTYPVVAATNVVKSE